jgi:gliding motility-associated-like protein
VRYFFLIIALGLPAVSLAQLSAPGSKAVRYTSYPSAASVKDPLFIYCNSTGSQKGTLNAISPKGTGPFNFSWYKWSDITKSFSIFLKTESGVSTSSAADLDAGGYKTVISGGFDTSLVGWIFFDRPPIVNASLQQQLCYRVALKGDTAFPVNSFYYRDKLSGLPVKLSNEKTFLWSSDPVSVIPFPDAVINPVSYTPPLEDVTYKLRVNNLGCSSESSFFYKSIHVKADFSVDPDKGEAPLEVSFTDKSIRGTLKYTWEFGDKTADGKKRLPWVVGQDSLSMFTAPFTHTYYKPGEYSVKLTVESVLHCIDSMRFDKVVVDDSEVHIPNVFTPDGDGNNDNFFVEFKSLRYITVEVFSRSGLMVYSFHGEGESLREWTGWDGNVNNSSIKAAPGVYFFLIRAYGWDDIDYNGKEHRGFVYLYR